MIRLYAAGSHMGALADTAKAYEPAGGERVDATFDPSGLLKDEIVVGANADVFASANMERARALHEAQTEQAGDVLRAQSAVRAGAAESCDGQRALA
jgi:ABC-type molybdate transport system substrate-binding protein